jgi:uncharacterized damage-inducible protein DinB
MEFRLINAIDILSRTPSTLNALLRDVSDDWVLQNEGLETWSPFDVVGHLIHGEETDWIPRARMILADGESQPFEPFDRFAMFEKSKGKSIGQLLDKFQQLREANLRALKEMNLTDSMLEQRGRHPELGLVTLKQLLATWVAHDLGHIAQVVRVMAKQYKQEVGPWQQYLSILTR